MGMAIKPDITLCFEPLREPLVAQGALTILLAPLLVSGVDGLVGAGSGLFDETDILDEFRESSSKHSQWQL